MLELEVIITCILHTWHMSLLVKWRHLKVNIYLCLISLATLSFTRVYVFVWAGQSYTDFALSVRHYTCGRNCIHPAASFVHKGSTLVGIWYTYYSFGKILILSPIRGISNRILFTTILFILTINKLSKLCITGSLVLGIPGNRQNPCTNGQ